MQPFHGPDRKYDFQGVQGTVLKSNHYLPKYEVQKRPHPTQPHVIGVMTFKSLLNERKKREKVESYYIDAPDFPSDFHNEEGEKLEHGDVEYVSCKFELHDLTKPYLRAPQKQWKTEIKNFDFRESIYQYYNNHFEWTLDYKAVRIMIGGRLIFIDLDTFEEIWTIDSFRWGSEKDLSKDIFFTRACDDLSYNWYYKLYDLKNKKMIGEPRKVDGFKAEIGCKYYPEQVFMMPDEPDRLYMPCKKKNSTNITLAYLEISKGLNHDPKDYDEKKFSFPSKEIQVEELWFNTQCGIALTHNSQLLAIIEIKKNKTKKIELSKDGTNYFNIIRETYFIYESIEDGEFYYLDFKTMEETKLDKEEGERLKELEKKVHDQAYDLKTKTYSGRNVDKTADEDLKKLELDNMWGIVKPGEKFLPTYTAKYGKFEIMTNRLMAYMPFCDKIHLFDFFNLQTTVIELNSAYRFIGFCNQVDEDYRKISFISVRPDDTVSVSHIWLNQIEHSADKSIEKIERDTVIIDGLQIPALTHRAYWESYDGNEGVFMQQTTKISYWQKDEESGKYSKIFDDEAEPMQCIRPQYEKKRRWLYIQKNDTNSDLKYVTLGEKAPKKAFTYEDVSLWAISIYQHGYYGPNKGEQYVICLDTKRQIELREIHWHKASEDIVSQRKYLEERRLMTQYAHDMVSKLKGRQNFMGFEASFDPRFGKGSVVISGAQFMLFNKEEWSPLWNEIEEYLHIDNDESKLDRHTKRESLQDNFYYHGERHCYAHPEMRDLGAISVIRKFNHDWLTMPFKCHHYFQVYDENDPTILKYFLFFKDNRIPIVFTPMLKVLTSYDFSEILEDQRTQEELDKIGFQPEEDADPTDPVIERSWSSPNRRWQLFKMTTVEDIEFFKLAHFDMKKGFTKVQEIDYLKKKDKKVLDKLEVSNEGGIYIRDEMKIVYLDPYEERKGEVIIKEVNLLEKCFKGKDWKEITHLQITHDNLLLLVIDTTYIYLLDRDWNESKHHEWNPFNPEESIYVDEKFDITEAAPYSDDPEEERIGIILQNTKDDTYVVIVWNLEHNSEVCMHTVKNKVNFIRSPGQLHFQGNKTLRSALIGNPEIFENEIDNMGDDQENHHKMLAELDQNMIISNDSDIRLRSCQVYFPHRPWNAMFQRFLLKRKRNYVLGKRLLTFYKDPASGESIFTQIGFKMDFLQEFLKAVELCAEQHEEGVKDVYSLLLEASFLEPKKPSLFKKACKISSTFQNAYLLALADCEEDYNTNSVVIPNTTEFLDMLECSNFGAYLEACKREVEPDPVYKGYWKHEEDRLTFLRPFSYVNLEFKAKELGYPTDSKEQEEIKGFLKKHNRKALKKPEENVQEQNVFLEAIQLDMLHKKNGVREFCEMMATCSDDKLLSLKVINVIVEVLWEIMFPRILKQVLLPYLVYFFSFIIYISYLYDPDYKEPNPVKYVFLPACMIYSGYVLYFESTQMRELGWSYFTETSSIWNVLDLMSSGLVIIFALIDLFQADFGSITYLLGALAVFNLWLKIFYFMRLFKNLSFFVRMIVEMFIDIRFFLLVFFTAIFAFSNTFMILDYTFQEQDQIVKNSFGIAVNYFYMQSIGDYQVDGYAGTPHETVYWLYYYMSTIFIQITLLNLIIAIMGDTYDRVVEVKQESSLKEVCSFISEYFLYFPKSDFEKNSLILIAGLEGSDQKKGATWEGKLGVIKASFRTHISNVENKLMKMNESIKVDMEKGVKSQSEQKNQMEQMQIQLRNQAKTHTAMVEEFEEKLKANQEAVKSHNEMLDTLLKHYGLFDEEEEKKRGLKGKKMTSALE